MELAEAIAIAKKECKDPYAQSYLQALKQSEVEGGSNGVKVQLLYCLSNMRTWRGETARAVKEVFKRCSKDAKLCINIGIN
jgi:hypothetical protein